jgi:predicted sulfurtransferase
MAAHGVTGRLRVAGEGYNATLTATRAGARAFCERALPLIDAATFDGTVDFKYVDGLPAGHALPRAKCWAVREIVTYGFPAARAPLGGGAAHLDPRAFHEALRDPESVVIDVRNANETTIGRFAPEGGARVLDPGMRRSTDFPAWVRKHRSELAGRRVLMYCTGGVRCERASAFLRAEGLAPAGQLAGGVHRYLEAFPDAGGHWVGKNYVFDRRFSHGARGAATIGACRACAEPWDRFQAGAKCDACGMEVLLCRTCQRSGGGNKKKYKGPLRCHLCA